MTGLHWKSERRAGGHPPYYWGTGSASERHERGKTLNKKTVLSGTVFFVPGTDRAYSAVSFPNTRASVP